MSMDAGEDALDASLVGSDRVIKRKGRKRRKTKDKKIRNGTKE